MSAESLARADADLVDTLRRLHQCRRELDEQRHDAAAVARLQPEIDALVARKDSARQLCDAERAQLHAAAHDFPRAAETDSEEKRRSRCERIAHRCKLKYCLRTPESNTRLLTLLVLLALCVAYFVAQLEKIDASRRIPVIQSTQTPRDCIASPPVFVCSASRGVHTFIYAPKSCTYGNALDCTPGIYHDCQRCNAPVGRQCARACVPDSTICYIVPTLSCTA